LTAQARLSGAILGVLPVGFFGFLWLTSPGEMVATVSSGVGLAAIGVGLILDAAAYLWIRRLLEVG
jgi:Flp pilus assembly protein TadB